MSQLEGKVPTRRHLHQTLELVTNTGFNYLNPRPSIISICLSRLTNSEKKKKENKVAKASKGSAFVT